MRGIIRQFWASSGAKNQQDGNHASWTSRWEKSDSNRVLRARKKTIGSLWHPIWTNGDVTNGSIGDECDGNSVFFWRHALSAQIPLTAFVFSHPNAAPPSYLSSVSPRWSAACGKVRRANRSQQLLLAEAAWPNTEAVKFSARASGALAGRHLSSWRALHRVKYSRQICLARYRAPLYHATLLVSSRKCVIRSIDSQPPSQQA